MFIVIETSTETNFISGESNDYVSNVYGPFPTIEEAEEFRKKQRHPNDFEPYLLISPTEAN